MERVHIWTRFWLDEKVMACPWPEKMVLLFLLTNSKLTTMGFIQINLAESEQQLNSTERHVKRWAHRKPIKSAEIKVALDSLRRRKIILLDPRVEQRIFLINFLKNAGWPPSVVKGWPRKIQQLHISPKMERAIRKACVQFCERRSIEIPNGLATGRQKDPAPLHSGD